MPLAVHSASMFSFGSATAASRRCSGMRHHNEEDRQTKSAPAAAAVPSPEVAAQHQGGPGRAARPRIIAVASPDLAKRAAGIEPSRRYVVVVELEKDRAHA